MSLKPDLRLLLKGAGELAGTSAQNKGTRKDLDSSLQARLTRCREVLGSEVQTQIDSDGPDYQKDTELEMALASLNIIAEVHNILQGISNEKDGSTTGQSNVQPPLGLRDMAQLRILVSIIFRWGTDKLLERLFSPPAAAPEKPHIVDLASSSADSQLAYVITSRILAILFPEGPTGRPSQNSISVTILNRHATDILKACVALGWPPKSSDGDTTPVPGDFRPITLRLLSYLPPSQCIASLGAILSSTQTRIPHIRKICATLLSRQLMRKDGVQGLFSALLGESASADTEADFNVPLSRLEQLSKLLVTPPAGVTQNAYFRVIIPRVLTFLIPTNNNRNVPSAHIRAAAFCLSIFLSLGGPQSPSAEVISPILLPILHTPFLQPLGDVPQDVDPAADSESGPVQPPTNADELRLTPSAALDTLSNIVANADPSPVLISSLLTPIIAPLYDLHEYLYRKKTADPTVREAVTGLLKTWGRAVDTSQGITALLSVLHHEETHWVVDIAGELRMEKSSARPRTITLADLAKMAGGGGYDADSNPLNLHPDPVIFVTFIRDIDREDISTELFVELLDLYSNAKAVAGADPLRALLLLQIILQVQTKLTGTTSASNIFKEPHHILIFIQHALERATEAPESHAEDRLTNVSGRLRVDIRSRPEVDASHADIDEGGDSDDEDAPGLEGVSRGDEMTVTAINLLLSVLEANPDLSARTAPVLNETFDKLETLLSGPSDTVRPLAREARMVMTARLASTSVAGGAGPKGGSHIQDPHPEEDIRVKYQRALKLLQDPILPVRAHGLLILRELVRPPSYTKALKTGTTSTRTSLSPAPIDPAYIPAILSIFLESVQDDDSYIYLNGVQGLAAMVDGFGKDVLRGLLDTYTKGLDDSVASLLTDHEVQVKIRVGEALGQVIVRCGEALANYVDILLPPLLKTVQASGTPTVLKASAISLLAQMVDTNALALSLYVADLVSAMLDLLQIEVVVALKVGAGEHKEHKDAQGREESSTATTHDRIGVDKGSRLHQGPEAEEPKEQADAYSNRPPEVKEENLLRSISSGKLPPSRRAALHFLSLLIRAATRDVYTERGGAGAVSLFPGSSVKRAKVILEYVAATDPDDVARVMAREAQEGLKQLADAMFGVLNP